MPQANADHPSRPRLPRAFYQRDPRVVAPALLGQRLVRLIEDDYGNAVRLAGLIVEAEAYCGVEDAAAHTFGGRRTPRVASMWRRGGTAYVYFTYGMHHCFNVVTQDKEHPTAVLIRAIEPTEGLDTMRANRPAARRDTDLCSGPAKLTAALAIDRELDGDDLVAGNRLGVEQVRARRLPDAMIATGPRVGIAYATRHPGGWDTAPLRFWIANHPHVSRPPASSIAGSS